MKEVKVYVLKEEKIIVYNDVDYINVVCGFPDVVPIADKGSEVVQRRQFETKQIPIETLRLVSNNYWDKYGLNREEYFAIDPKLLEILECRKQEPRLLEDEIKIMQKILDYLSEEKSKIDLQRVFYKKAYESLTEKIDNIWYNRLWNRLKALRKRL